MNPFLVFGLGAVTGIGLKSCGRPLLVRLFRAGMVTTGYAKTVGSYAAAGTRSLAETASSLDLGRLVPDRHAEESRPEKSPARRKSRTNVQTPKKKTSKTKSRSRPEKKKTASRPARKKANSRPAKKKTGGRPPKATS